MLSSKNPFCIVLETEKSKVKQVENLGRALGSASMMVYPYLVEARKDRMHKPVPSSSFIRHSMT